MRNHPRGQLTTKKGGSKCGQSLANLREVGTAWWDLVGMDRFCRFPVRNVEKKFPLRARQETEIGGGEEWQQESPQSLGLLAWSPGLCLIVSVEVMRQSVKRMIDSEDTVWIEYYYSWSFACACAAFTLLFLGGLLLLLFSLPRMPQNPWESCMDAEPEH